MAALIETKKDYDSFEDIVKLKFGYGKWYDTWEGCVNGLVK